MGKSIIKQIEKVELIKIEKIFNNPEKKLIFYYNLFLEGIDEPLLFTNPEKEIETDLTGLKIKFKFNEENLISEFELV